MIRILAADDSVVIRMTLSELFATEPDMNVVATASNGRIALRKLAEHEVDILVLDLEMPEMGGLEVLAELQRTRSRIPVVILSSHGRGEYDGTMEALLAGAADYVQKPIDATSRAAARETLRELLVPRIRSILGCGGAQEPPASPSAASLRPPAPFPRSAVTAKVEIIGIGTSTGGPNALAEVMRAFPADFSAPVVIVQHMPAFFTAQLAARLDQISGLTVREGSRGEVLQPGCAYLAPAEHHMTLERSPDGVRIKIDQGPKVHSCRPAVDPLFRTLADVYGNSALVAILTGMGYDGSAGCEAVRDAGGRVIAQDEPTSVVWGMPGAVVTAGLADSILPLPDIGPTLVRLVNTSRGRPATEPGITERTS